MTDFTQKASDRDSERIIQNLETRRKVVLGLLASIGAASTMSCAERVETLLDDNPLPLVSDTQFYSQSEFALINRLADLIIPDTDTPGAIAVGVPVLMDKLNNEWASTDSKAHHKKAINFIRTELDLLGHKNFLALNKNKQAKVLAAFDNKAFSEEGFTPYKEVKGLIARSYYLSEIGATQELRHEAVPGRWQACVPFKQIGKTWAV